ncbi:uncharacterized protein [Prorops nasuta]|uniref:uncharacterized protein isoform X2 n=1 Tax=Prorops nasuta TaxID=863751 RepID=UPI0034D013BA
MKFFLLCFIYLLGIKASNSIVFSSPKECARNCKDGEPPKYCYVKFILEYYTSNGMACNWCMPNITNQLSTEALCECIIADGIEKTVLSINRMIPGPTIQVCKGDHVIIDLENAAEGLEVTIHWHGVFQNGYQYYDGVPFITQCPIPSGNTFRYDFVVDNEGTHFYHSHISVQMMDGQYGGLIVRVPKSQEPNGFLYDEDLAEHIMVISDWMHELSLEHYPGKVRSDIGQTPDNILINGRGKYTDPVTKRKNNIPYYVFNVDPGKRYRFRVINGFGTVCLAQLTIEWHSLQIIAMDGENVQAVKVDSVIMGSGERLDFVLSADQPPGSYWIQVKALGECRTSELQQFAILRYSGQVSRQQTNEPGYSQWRYNWLFNPQNATGCSGAPPNNGRLCVNQMQSFDQVDPRILRVNPDLQLILPFDFVSYNSTLTTFFGPKKYDKFFADVSLSVMRNISYVEPISPLISQREGYKSLCNPNQLIQECRNPGKYTACSCTHTYNITLDSIVEVVIYDQTWVEDLSHPFHLHGHSFYVFDIGQFTSGNNITSEKIQRVLQRHQARLMDGDYINPARKDTITVPINGFATIRFIANNPGWWMMHCHFLWHTVSGMDVIFHVGEPDDLPPIPENFPTCSSFVPDVNV